MALKRYIPIDWLQTRIYLSRLQAILITQKYLATLAGRSKAAISQALKLGSGEISIDILVALSVVSRIRINDLLIRQGESAPTIDEILEFKLPTKIVKQINSFESLKAWLVDCYQTNKPDAFDIRLGFFKNKVDRCILILEDEIIEDKDIFASQIDWKETRFFLSKFADSVEFEEYASLSGRAVSTVKGAFSAEFDGKISVVIFDLLSREYGLSINYWIKFKGNIYPTCPYQRLGFSGLL